MTATLTTAAATTATATTTTAHAEVSKAARIAGKIIYWLVVAFLVVDAVPKMMSLQVVVNAAVEGGVPEHIVPVIGTVLAVCLAFYLVPRTAILGAVLLTGYLGGATCFNLVTEKPIFNVFFAVGFGVLVWAGLWLQDRRVREIMPLIVR